MRRLQLLVIAVGCLIAGPVLIYRHFAALPQLDELTKVTGELSISAESRWTGDSTSQHPILMVRGAPGRYKYLDWFPRADRIPNVLSPGDRVTLWTDAGRNDWVWQIERDGQMIVSYAEVRDAVAANEQYNLWLGPGVLALAVVAAAFLFRSFRTSA